MFPMPWLSRGGGVAYIRGVEFCVVCWVGEICSGWGESWWLLGSISIFIYECVFALRGVFLVCGWF